MREPLHDFDLDLCQYILTNIRTNLPDQVFEKWLHAELGDGPIWQHFMEGLGDPHMDPKWMLFSEAELFKLQGALEGGLPETDRLWIPNEYVHQRYLNTLPIISREIGKKAMVKWADVCGNFIEQLETNRLLIPQAVVLVGEWISELRRLLRAMSATEFLPSPEGACPTPSHPEAGKELFCPPELADAVTKLRKLIAAFESQYPGTSAPAKVLLGKAQVSRERGFRALRLLQGWGEYKGFTRPPRRRRGEISN